MSLGWVQIQTDLCAYKKRTFGHRHTQREDHVKTNRKQLSISQEESFTGNQTGWNLFLGLPNFPNCEKKYLLIKSPIYSILLQWSKQTNTDIQQTQRMISFTQDSISQVRPGSQKKLKRKGMEIITVGPECFTKSDTWKKKYMRTQTHTHI